MEYDGLPPELFELDADPQARSNLAGGASASLEDALARRLVALAREAAR